MKDDTCEPKEELVYAHKTPKTIFDKLKDLLLAL